MALVGARTRRIEFKTARIIRKSTQAGRLALDAVAKEMTIFVRGKINKPYPPASRPGQEPHKRTGRLQSGFVVVRTGKSIGVRTSNIGIWLDGGTRKMAARPFIRKHLHDKRRKWEARLSAKLKQFRRQLET